MSLVFYFRAPTHIEQRSATDLEYLEKLDILHPTVTVSLSNSGDRPQRDGHDPSAGAFGLHMGIHVMCLRVSACLPAGWEGRRAGGREGGRAGRVTVSRSWSWSRCILVYMWTCKATSRANVGYQANTWTSHTYVLCVLPHAPVFPSPHFNSLLR